jgi:hypothetical protein
MADVTLQPWWFEQVLSEEMLIHRVISNPWDIVYIDGVALPGISDVKCSKGPKLDVKNSAGRHFATITAQGYKPCDVVITTLIWTPYQSGIWQAIVLPILEPEPTASYTAKPQAHAISHPVTHMRRVEAITIENIEGPSKGPLVGSKQFVIKALQWSKDFQGKATVTAKSAGVNPHTNALTTKDPKHAPVPSRP